MAAKKAKAKKTVTFEVPHGGYSDARRSTVTIVVGEKITIVTTGERISMTQKTKVAVFGRPGPNLSVTARLAAHPWLHGLADPLREELGHILSESTTDGIAADWIEDHGGKREWALQLEGVDRRARESFTEERTFAIGDYATHGGYNLTYYGKILSITEKTVIVENDYGTKTRRMTIGQFCQRNWQFDLATVQKRNSEWSD